MSKAIYAPGLSDEKKRELDLASEQSKLAAKEPDSGEPENTLKAKAQSQFKANFASFERTAEKEEWLASLNAKKGFKTPW